MNEDVAGMGPIISPTVSPEPGVPLGGSNFNHPGSGSGDLIVPFNDYIITKPKPLTLISTKTKKRKKKNRVILPFNYWISNKFK